MAYTSEAVEYHGIPYTKFGGHVFNGVMDSEVNGRKPPFSRVQWGQQAEEFQAREDDIWISAYPKSGHHWSHQYLSMILNGSAEFVPGVKESSFFEMLLPKRFGDMQSPRMLFTHINTGLMPKDVFKKKSKILFLSRNPKDVAVSGYYHCFRMIYRVLGRNDSPPSFSAYLDDFLDGKVEGGSWFKYTKQWWNLSKENSNILVVIYEDLKQDTGANIKKIAEFLGKPIDVALSKAIAEAVEFASLKSYVSRQQEENSINVIPGFMAAMYRKGMVGDWKNHFTVADNEKFDKLFSEEMTGCDLKVQFEIP